MTILVIILAVVVIVLVVALFLQVKAARKQAEDGQQLLADYQRRVDEQQRLLEDYNSLSKNFENIGKGYEQALLLFDKMADIRHNMDDTRLGPLSEAIRQKRVDKYAPALALLEQWEAQCREEERHE